jgi:hypothetical protein
MRHHRREILEPWDVSPAEMTPELKAKELERI